MQPDQKKKIELVAKKDPNFFFSDSYDYGSYKEDLKPVKIAAEQIEKELQQISGALGVDQTGSAFVPTLKNYNVQVLNEFKDPIRERVKDINSKYVYTFDFKKSQDIQNFFKALNLSPNGKNDKGAVPNYIYKGIKTNILEKIYNDFKEVFGDDFINKINNKEQLFENIFDGFTLRTFQSDKKQNYDKKSKEFDKNNNAVISAIIKEIFKDPTLLGVTDNRPKLFGIYPEDNDYYTNKIEINQKILKDYTTLVSDKDRKYIGFGGILTEKFINGESETDYKNIYDYLNLVSQQFINTFNYVLHPQQQYNPDLTYEKYCNSGPIGQVAVCQYLAYRESNNPIPSDKEYLGNLIYNILDFQTKVTQILKETSDFYNSPQFPEVLEDVGSDINPGIVNIKKQINLQKNQDILVKFINCFKDIVSKLPDDIKLQRRTYLPLALDNIYTDDLTIREIGQHLYELLINPIDKIHEYNIYSKDFNDYYKKVIKEKINKVDPTLAILKNFNIKYPEYLYTEGLLYPEFYGPPPNLDISLLYKKQVDLYLNKDPRVLFTFEKPQVLSFEKIEEPLKNISGAGNYEPSKKQKYLNSIQPTNIFVYRTNQEINNLKTDLVSDSFLKKLNIESGQTSYYENLEPNKDYYYFYVAQYGDDIPPSQQTIYYYSNTYFIIISDDLYYVCSPIIRVKLVKDNNFYYLEKESINLSKFDKKISKDSFKEKVKFVPEGEIFSVGTNGFINNQQYIKVRVTSKKTRKKVDLNLKYTINAKKIEIDDADTSKLENVEDMVDKTIQKKIQSKFNNKPVNDKIGYLTNIIEYAQNKAKEFSNVFDMLK